MKRKILFDDEIYQEYKQGSSVKEIMAEYGITLTRFLKEMHKEGGDWFSPFLFNKRKMSYVAPEEIEDIIKKKLNKNISINKIYYKRKNKSKVYIEINIEK